MGTKGAPAVYRAAQLVVEAYASHTEHGTVQEYFEGLTDALDDLCEAFGLDIPRFEDSPLQMAKAGVA